MLIELLIFLVSLFVLAKSSDLVINNAIKFSRAIKLKEIAIGFAFLGIATNLPEMSIAGAEILSGNMKITVGNLFGSTIADICVILGMLALIKPIKVSGGKFKEFSTLFFYSALTPLLLLLVNITYATKLIGVGLILMFIYFSYRSGGKRIFLKVKEPVKFKYAILIFLIVGLFGVVASSKLIVDSTSIIAKGMGITETVIGATIISATTILPEMSLCYSSIKKNRVSLALGTLIGSAVSEITLIFGSVLVLSTFIVDMGIFSTLLMFTLLTNMIAWRFFETDRKLDRFEGTVLLLIYAIFLITTLGVQVTLLGFFK